MGANVGFMRAEFGGAWSRDWNFKAENRKEVDKFVPVYLGKYGIDEKMFVILNTLSTTFLLVMFIYPNLVIIFLFSFISLSF